MEPRGEASVVALVLLAAVAGPALAVGGPASGGSTPVAAGLPPDGLATADVGTDRLAATDDRPEGPVPADGAATDGLAQFALQPGIVEAAPGEEVTVTVTLRSSPQIASGAYKAGFVLDFNASVLRATNVSRGPFMGLRRNTTVRTNQSAFDNQQGFVLYELVRDPPNGGVAGAAAFAYVTFEVREDAPEGTYPISFFRTLVLLTDGNFQRVSARGAEFTVNETATPTPTAAPTSTPPTTTATATETPTVRLPDTPGGDGPGAIVGVTALLVTVGLLVGVLVLVRRA